MNRFYQNTARVCAVLLLGLLLGACDKAETASYSDAPTAFHPSDECHVCGMIISEFPGPKGQVVERNGVKKFCSTAEMLGWFCNRKTTTTMPSSTSTTWAAARGTRPTTRT